LHRQAKQPIRQPLARIVVAVLGLLNRRLDYVYPILYRNMGMERMEIALLTRARGATAETSCNTLMAGEKPALPVSLSHAKLLPDYLRRATLFRIARSG